MRTFGCKVAPEDQVRSQAARADLRPHLSERPTPKTSTSGFPTVGDLDNDLRCLKTGRLVVGRPVPGIESCRRVEIILPG